MRPLLLASLCALVTHASAFTYTEQIPVPDPEVIANDTAIQPALDPVKSFVYTNNNRTPNSISAFAVGANGALSPVPGSPFLTGGNGTAGGLVASNRIASLAVKNLVFAANPGSDTVSAFSVNPNTGVLTAVPGSPFATGGVGSVSLSLSPTPDGRFLMAASAPSNTITVFSIAANGSLSPISGSPFPAGGGPDGIRVTPDGKFLAVALYNVNAVAMFNILSTGALTPVVGAPFPSQGAVALDCNCATSNLFVGGTGGVSVYGVSNAGALSTVAGSPFAVPVNGANVPLLSPDDARLFVSAGSNSISSFNVAPGGSLSGVAGGPFGNGGLPPAGLATTAGAFLYVASDGGFVNAFSVSPAGALSPVPGAPFSTGFTDVPGLRSLTVFPPKDCCLAPSVSGAAATPSVLSPVSQQMVDVTIDYTPAGQCSSHCVLSVASNEPVNGAPAWNVVDSHHVQLRADRNGSAARVYTITITCANDSNGLATSRTVTVTVPGATVSSAAVPHVDASSAIRINAGGGAYTDPQGNLWAADSGFSGGETYSVSNLIFNTDSPYLYNTERFASGPLTYTISAPNGSYTVNLKFAEIYFTSAGRRVFNIALNGQTVQSNFDIYAAAGGALRAVDRSFFVTVSNGQIVIQLTPVVENPKISAIEIIPVNGVSVSVSPGAVSLGRSQSWQFTANVTGAANTAVTWSLSPNVGTITATGLYTAPATIDAQQTVTVTATSVADPTKSGTAIVVLQYLSIVVSPAHADLGPLQTQQFSALVTGPSNTAVTWSLSPNIGTITATGLYTAPETISKGTTILVLATSQADPTKSGSANILLKAGTSFTPIRVNAGGDAYIDPAGNTWAADTGFTGGQTYSVSTSIPNTPAPHLYQSERYSPSGPLTYTFAVPNGNYTVTLKFAEIFFNSAGQRRFNILLNGQTVESNFDIFTAAGGANLPIDRAFPLSVTTGQIVIQLSPLVENPKISAIQITQPY